MEENPYKAPASLGRRPTTRPNKEITLALSAFVLANSIGVCLLLPILLAWLLSTCWL